MEISVVRYLLAEIYKLILSNLSKSNRDNKNFCIMLNSKSNKWKEEFQELRVKDLKKKPKSFKPTF